MNNIIEKVTKDLGRVHDLLSTVLSEQLSPEQLSLESNEEVKALLEYRIEYLESVFLNLNSRLVGSERPVTLAHVDVYL